MTWDDKVFMITFNPAHDDFFKDEQQNELEKLPTMLNLIYLLVTKNLCSDAVWKRYNQPLGPARVIPILFSV